MNKIKQTLLAWCVLLDATCVDCGKNGHYTKGYFKCELYEAETADQVDTSGKKRKQGYQIKNEKKKARMQETEDSNQSTSICTKCKQTGNTSASSPLCPQHILRKTEVLKLHLGENYQAYTRKVPFDNCVDQYKTKLKASVIDACSSVRYLVFKAKLFVNYYILENSTAAAPKYLFTQNFWYSVIQLINGKEPTNSIKLPDGFLSSFHRFKTEQSSILHPIELRPGVSKCISEACTELATSYTNAIVENFEQRFIYFLVYKLQTMFVSLPPWLVRDISHKFCYQEICQGDSKWPTSDYLTEEIKSTIQSFCQHWKQKLRRKVTLKELSKDPGSFVPFLFLLNAEFEQEHYDHKAEGHLIVIAIDEFKTSRICSFYSSDDVNSINTSGFKGCGVLHCKQCRKVWQRDVNASNNMMMISQAIWSGKERSDAFKHAKDSSP